MFRYFLLFMLTAYSLFPAVGFAFDGYVQPFGDEGTIDWATGELSAVRVLGDPLAQAEGAEDAVSQEPVKPLDPLAVRRAASGVRKQVLDMILSTRIDAKQTVSAYLADNAVLAGQVRGLVQNSPLERPDLYEGSGEVRAHERFRGKLAELVLPVTIPFQSGIPPKLSTSMENTFGYTSVPEEAGVGNSGFTGVIVDARGMRVTPALAPVIYGQDGVGAYGAFLVSRANAVAHGVVAYATSTDPQSLAARVGASPLTVRALREYGSWRTDLVVSTAMARLIGAVMQQADALEHCRVVIVVDAPVIETEEALTDGTVNETEAGPVGSDREGEQ